MPITGAMTPRIDAVTAVSPSPPPAPERTAAAAAAPSGPTFAQRLATAQTASFEDSETSGADTGTEEASDGATATADPTGGASANSASSASSAASVTGVVLKPTGEKLSAVSGHHWSKITSGPDSGMFLNQKKGSPRIDEAFNVVQHGGKTFHVYGSGASRVIVELP